MPEKTTRRGIIAAAQRSRAVRFDKYVAGVLPRLISALVLAVLVVLILLVLLVVLVLLIVALIVLVILVRHNFVPPVNI